jgi:hypothetical protein
MQDEKPCCHELRNECDREGITEHTWTFRVVGYGNSVGFNFLREGRHD